MINHMVRWRDEEEDQWRGGTLLHFVDDDHDTYGIVLSGSSYERVKMEALVFVKEIPQEVRRVI